MEFIKKADHVLGKPDPIVIKPKDVTENIQKFKQTIDQQKEQIKQWEQNIEVTKKDIEQNKERLKNMKKFEDWAIEFQKRKVKVLVENVKDRVRKSYSYKYDDTLSEEQNKSQQFYLYKSYIARQPEIQAEISEDIVQSEIINSNIIENPF